MYKRTPTTPTSDYARWLAEEDTDLTGPPGSSSKPKFAPADPSPEPTLKIPTDTKADGSVLEQVVEVMKEKQLLEATLARMEASMEAKLAQFEAMAAAKDEANELLQRKIDGLIAENDTIKKQIELQPEPQPSIPSMLQKTRADLKAVRQQLNEYDDATLVRLKPERICIAHLLGNCKLSNCFYQHKTNAEVIAALKTHQPAVALPMLADPPSKKLNW